MSVAESDRQHVATAPVRSVAYNVLIGLTTLAVLLQGVWAGIFLSYDNRPERWVNAHDWGARVAIVLALLATITAFVRLRARRDLLIGTTVLLVLLAVEGFIGGKITDGGVDKLTALHVPLAMLIMALAVILPIRARTGSRQNAARSDEVS